MTRNHKMLTIRSTNAITIPFYKGFLYDALLAVVFLHHVHIRVKYTHLQPLNIQTEEYHPVSRHIHSVVNLACKSTFCSAVCQCSLFLNSSKWFVHILNEAHPILKVDCRGMILFSKLFYAWYFVLAFRQRMVLKVI